MPYFFSEFVRTSSIDIAGTVILTTPAVAADIAPVKAEQPGSSSEYCTIFPPKGVKRLTAFACGKGQKIKEKDMKHKTSSSVLFFLRSIRFIIHYAGHLLKRFDVDFMRTRARI